LATDPGLPAGVASDNRLVFNSTSDGHQHILDFSAGDVLEFSHTAFGNLATGNTASGTLDSSHFETNTTGEASALSGAGAKFVFNTNDHTLYYDMNGGNAGGAIAMAKLENLANLQHTDIHIV
jgi:hypothetical protein